MKNFIPLSRSRLRSALLILTAVIFSAELLYNYQTSRSHSQNLTELQEKTYPILEKTHLLKLKFLLIQEEYYKAVTLKEKSRLVGLQEDANLFLRILAELEPLVQDREIVSSIRLLFFKYLQQANEISRQVVQDKRTFDSLQNELIDLTESSLLLAEAIETLNEKSRGSFQSAMKRSEQLSKLVLRVGFWSSIAGMILVGGFSGWIMSLNRTLGMVNKNLEGEVKMRMEEMESFVYTVSHDLKSPVVSIHGIASIYLEDYGSKMDEKEKRYIERIISNTNYMENLIQGLLALSRIGREAPNNRKATLIEVLRDIVEMYKEHLAEKRIEVEIQSSLPHFYFDRILLMQLFQNLISNAAKFMGDPPHPKIEIGGRETGEWVEFFVRDNGIGIDPAYHDKVFRIFHQLKDIEAEGAGIGLSIVKKIIDLAGGKIWIESKTGEGAAFFVRLRRKESKLDPDTTRFP